MTKTLLSRIFAALFLMLNSSAMAQTVPASPCSSEPYRAFDFWLGEWTVYTLNIDGTRGKEAGENSITSEENGCLLVERWTSINGGTGQSYNFFDPGTNKWRQVWVSDTVTINYDGELNEAGEMVLEGTISYRNGTTAVFKGVWTPLTDGSVKQHFEQFDAQKQEWNAWFTGLYLRKEISE